jgi:hypothetical protein
MTVPSDVSATAAPSENVTGPAFALCLLRPGHPTMDVVKVGYDAGELETWYRLELTSGRLGDYLTLDDVALRNKASGGVWDIPPGATVFPGMRLAKSSTS